MVSNQSTIDDFQLVQFLGEGGYAEVYLGEKGGDKYAIKLFDPSKPGYDVGQITNECNTVKDLDHKNIMQTYQFNENGKFTDTAGEQSTVPYLVLEYNSGAELISHVMGANEPFDEPTARFYFQQMLDGLDYMHSNGLCHRDIKAENVLLSSPTLLKIADFGFTKTSTDQMKTKIGTENYMAPEIYKGSYDGAVVDMFAAIVTLFVTMTSKFPFQHAKPADPFYKALIKSPGQFWQAFEQAKGEEFSSEFKDLIQRGLNPVPSKRLSSIGDVRDHAFMQNSIASVGQIEQMYDTRQEAIKQQKEEEAEAKKSSGGRKVMRGFEGKGEPNTFNEFTTKNNIEFSGDDRDAVWDQLIECVNNIMANQEPEDENDPKPSMKDDESTWQADVTFIGQIEMEDVGQGEVESDDEDHTFFNEQVNTKVFTVMNIELTTKDENTHYLQFKQVSGDQGFYYEMESMLRKFMAA